ncbi:MAG: tetratricopeptide repeat protein [Bryobacteraceae bacterium]
MLVAHISALALAVLLLPYALASQSGAYQAALEKYHSKHFEEALPIAEKALREEPANPQYLNLYGSILAALHQPGPAEEHLRKAAALAPDQAAFQLDLGYLLHQERKYVEAVPVLKRAIALDPANLMARFMLARCYVFSYHELGIPNFAELTLEQLNYIVKRNPRFPAVHHHLALVYINIGEPAKALPELRMELRNDPGNTQVRTELGETLIKLNRYDQAIQELQIAAAQAPGAAPVHFALAKAYRSIDRNSEALDAAQKCVQLDPRFADAHYLLGQLYRATNQPDLARIEFEQFRRIKGQNAPTP